MSEIKEMFNPSPVVQCVRFDKEVFIPFDCAVWLRDHMYKIPLNYQEEDGCYIFNQLSNRTIKKRKYNYSHVKIIGGGVSLVYVSYLL